MLSNVVIWFRQLFCEHMFEFDEQTEKEQLPSNLFDEYYSYGHVTRVSRTCKICGHHISYVKF